MFSQIIITFLLQIVSTVGVVFLFGWLIALCNKRFYANFGSLSSAVCYATGFFGTPVHELSHALFCLIFGHKIAEIKLFQISDDGTLGYVNHTYNKRNIYQRIGNFFIGIAPIIVISAILYLAAYLLLPSFTAEITGFVNSVSSKSFISVISGIGEIIASFFSLAVTWQWWVFLIVGILLSLHMTLSGADIKGALSGLVFVLAIFLIVDVVLALIGNGLLSEFTSGVLSVASYLICFLTMALVVSLIALSVSYICKAIIMKK